MWPWPALLDHEGGLTRDARVLQYSLHGYDLVLKIADIPDGPGEQRVEIEPVGHRQARDAFRKDEVRWRHAEIYRKISKNSLSSPGSMAPTGMDIKKPREDAKVTDDSMSRRKHSHSIAPAL